MEEETAAHSRTLAWGFHGQRSLAGYSPWGRKELDVTERLSVHIYRALSERWLGLCRPLSTPTPLRRGSAFPLLGQLWLGTHGVVLSACLFRPKGWRHCPTITHLGWGHPLVGPWLWPHTANRHPSCALQWKPGRVTICDTHTLSDHPLLCMVASGMLHNLTVPQFPSSVKCLLRVVDRPCWYTEGALRKPYVSMAIIFMISVSLCKAPLQTLKLV